MTFRKLAELLGRMHYFIRHRNTGTLEEFASKLSINRSTAFRYLETIRSYGAIIYYDRSIKSYCYHEDIEVQYHETFKVSKKY